MPEVTEEPNLSESLLKDRDQIIFQNRKDEP